MQKGHIFGAWPPTRVNTEIVLYVLSDIEQPAAVPDPSEDVKVACVQTRRMDVTIMRRATAPVTMSGTAEEEDEGEEEKGGPAAGRLPLSLRLACQLGWRLRGRRRRASGGREMHLAALLTLIDITSSSIQADGYR